MSIYRLRTFIGYLRSPQKKPQNKDGRRVDTTAARGDPLRFIYNCPRQNRTVLLDAYLYELLYAPYLSKIDGDGIVIMNPHGVYAAKASGKRVVVDLMDLWSCRHSTLQFNAFDFHTLKRADLVLAWSKAITALLKSARLRHVEYLPYGLDLESFDPLTVHQDIFLERYNIDSAVFRIVYSGGVWRVDGKDVLGVEKHLLAFKLVEKREEIPF